MAQIEDALVPAFIIEEFEDGRYTVFVPSIPTPLAGSVYILDRKRVHPLDVPFAQALKTVSRWGSVARTLLRLWKETAIHRGNEVGGDRIEHSGPSGARQHGGGGRCSAGRSALRAGFAAYGTRVPKWGRPCAGAPMRVVKRVVVYPSGFSFQAKPAARSATEWSGVARASGGVPDPT